MKRLCAVALFVLVGGLSVPWVPAQTQTDLDEQTLRGSSIPTDADGLIRFFELRSLKEGQAKELEELVSRLDSKVYRVREPAYKELVTRGSMALPFLKKALSNSSLETKRRAETCIGEIEKSMQVGPVAAAARILAARKPDRAAEILMNFLPSVSNDVFLEEEILTTIGKLALPPGKVDPLILQSLTASTPHRRAAAAYLLGRHGDISHRSALRKMLSDPDALVIHGVRDGILGKRPAQTLEEAFTSEEKLLRDQKIELTDASVLKYFRDLTLSDKDQERFRALVKDLGRGVYAVREAASIQLLNEKTKSLPFLKQVEFDTNVELSRRARLLLEKIRSTTNTAVPMAAAHWLARPGAKKEIVGEAVKTLLAYIPFADDEMVEQEILASLLLLSLRETDLDASLVTALADPMAIRRAAAAYVIGYVGVPEQVAQAKALLDDPHPVARLRAAQGLLAARDKAALPCLVELVQHVPAPYLNQVEEPLHRLAQDKGPLEAIVATSIESRTKVSKAWANWLTANEARLNLHLLDDRESYLGLITICEYDSRVGNVNGQVWETNRADQKRWTFGGVVGAMDARTLPNGRVLVAENSGQRVTERDSKGAIVWSHQVPANPICAQRLPNGNTFIGCYNMVLEVRPDKSEVYRYTPGPNFFIFGAHKGRNGNIVAITQQGTILELDSKTGRQIHSVQTQTQNNWCGVELLNNGNYLVAAMFPQPGAVREIDRKGTEVWSKPFNSAFRATKLPNGNVLVAGMNSRQVAEMDRAGNIRWSTTTAGRPWSVHYR